MPRRGRKAGSRRGPAPPTPAPHRLSGRAYARHAGVTPHAVQKRIQDGAIAEAVDDRGMIDVALADRLWAERTDPSKPLNRVSGNPKHRKVNGMVTPVTPRGAAQTSANVKPEASHEKFHGARGERESWAAKRERLDYLEARGLIRRRYSKLALGVVSDLARMVRDHLAGAADRLQQLHGPIVGEAVRKEHGTALQAVAAELERRGDQLEDA